MIELPAAPLPATDERTASLMAANQALHRLNASLAGNAAAKLPIFGESLFQIAAHANASSATLFLLDNESGTMSIQASWHGGQIIDVHDDARYAIWREPFSSRLIPRWEEFSTKLSHRYVRFADLLPEQACHMAVAWHIARGHKAMLTIALLVGQRAQGIVGLGFAHDEAMEDWKLEIIQVLASQIALAMHMQGLSDAAAAEAKRAAVLAERNRIAQDMHDTLAQGFTGILMQLGASEAASARGDGDTARGCVQRALELARGSLVDARRAVHALQAGHAGPPVSLATATSTMIEQMTLGSTLLARCRSEGDEVALDDAQREALMRITQEAVTNAVRHSRAGTLEVALRWHQDRIEIRVSDDGIGFNESVASDGMGLTGMRQRADRIGGVLSVDSAVGRGTLILVTAPLRHG